MPDFDLKTIISIVVGLLVLGGLIWLLLRQNYKQMADLLSAANTNEPLLNAIETIGKSTPPEVVNALIGVLNMVVSVSGNANPDIAAAVKQLETLIKTVTDGQPNTTTANLGGGQTTNVNVQATPAAPVEVPPNG